MLTPTSAAARTGLVRPVRVDPSGLRGPTAGQARGPGWRRSSRGLYVPSDVDSSRAEQRILEAAAALPAYGGVTGWAALRWLGGVWFGGVDASGPLPIHLATGAADVRNQPGLVISQERLHADEIEEVDGVRLTGAARSACFMMRYARDVRRAVVVADMAAYSGLLSTAESALFQEAHPGWTGIPQAREALALSDENSWSPPETLLRLVWELDAGRPRPLTNRPIFDRHGRHLATPDLLDPEAGVYGEYDGGHHLSGQQRARDVARVALLRSHGLEEAVVLAPDLADRDLVVRRIEAAYARARFAAPSRRSWTIQLPAWWAPSHTVDLRRDLPQGHPALRVRRQVA